MFANMGALYRRLGDLGYQRVEAGWIGEQGGGEIGLERLAAAVGDKARRRAYRKERRALKRALNAGCWDRKAGYYWDRDASGGSVPVKTAATTKRKATATKTGIGI